MSVYSMKLACDIPRCPAWCLVERPDIAQVRAYAAEQWGYSRTPDGGDQCGPCTRGDTPASRGTPPAEKFGPALPPVINGRGRGG